MSYVPRQYMDQREDSRNPYESATPMKASKNYETHPIHMKYFGNQEASNNIEDHPIHKKYFGEEKGLLSKAAEGITRAADIAGTGIYSGLRSIPRTGFDLLKTVAKAAGGDISKLEESQENAPEWLKKFGSYVFPTYEEQEASMQEKGSPKAEGFFENALQKGSRFVGEAPAFGGLGGLKGLASTAGLATGLQAAEEEELGPIGSMAAGLAGSLAPSGIKGLIQGVSNFAKNPKASLAKVAASFTKSDKLALQKQIIEDARKAGVNLDLGSITGSNIIRQMQSSLAQSGLTGDALDNLKKQMSEQVIGKYKNLADNLGNARFESAYHAGDVIKNAVTAERDFAKNTYRDLYQKAMSQVPEDAIVHPDRVIRTINRLEKELTPGSIKGAQKKSVLSFIEDLKKDVLSAEGTPKGAKVKDLLNDKIELHDILDYEVSGGVKQHLKSLAHEIDQNIQQYAGTNGTFAKEYKAADKNFSEYAKDFSNKNIASSLKTQDPAQILNKMKTSQGIKDLRKVLSRSTEGKELFDELSRFKLDDLIFDNMVSGTENQVQFGKFSNLLDKGNNREIVKELLGTKDSKKLEDLMKVSGKLAESANKFANTSQSATKIADLAAIAKILGDVVHLSAGNPWPLAKSTATWVTARQTAKLLADPEFLRLAEDAVLALKSGNPKRLENSLVLLADIARTNSRNLSAINSAAQEENK